MAKRDRLISIAGTEIGEMDPMRLKASILKSEGRVICGQHLLFANTGLVRGVTNSELMFAFGADMVMLNTYNFNDESKNHGMQGLSLAELKALCRRPDGIPLMVGMVWVPSTSSWRKTAWSACTTRRTAPRT